MTTDELREKVAKAMHTKMYPEVSWDDSLVRNETWLSLADAALRAVDEAKASAPPPPTPDECEVWIDLERIGNNSREPIGATELTTIGARIRTVAARPPWWNQTPWCCIHAVIPDPREVERPIAEREGRVARGE